MNARTAEKIQALIEALEAHGKELGNMREAVYFALSAVEQPGEDLNAQTAAAALVRSAGDVGRAYAELAQAIDDAGGEVHRREDVHIRATSVRLVGSIAHLMSADWMRREARRWRYAIDGGGR